MEGTVKWFNAAKGWGFITPTDGSKDIFFYGSEAPSSLRDGDRVEFEVVQGNKGPQAKNVHVVGGEPKRQKSGHLSGNLSVSDRHTNGRLTQGNGLE